MGAGNWRRPALHWERFGKRAKPPCSFSQRSIDEKSYVEPKFIAVGSLFRHSIDILNVRQLSVNFEKFPDDASLKTYQLVRGRPPCHKQM